MSNIQPVYPSGIFSWTDRVDNVSLDLAGDINSVASDLISVENTLGTNPQIETAPPTGTSITYPSVSSRISDAMTSVQMPVCVLTNSSVQVPNTTSGNMNPYTVSYDPYKMFNGTDITIPANGWWNLSASQIWTWWNNGYVKAVLTLNGSGNVIDESLLDWQFSGNTGTGSTPRWQQFGKRPRLSKLTFQGLLHQGDRISVYSENGTSNASFTINSLTLKASMIKTVSGTFTSG